MILLINRPYNTKKNKMKSLRESLRMVNESAPSDVKRAAKEAQKMLDDKKLIEKLTKKIDPTIVNGILTWYKNRIWDVYIGEYDAIFDPDDLEDDGLTPVEAFWDELALDCGDTDGASGQLWWDDKNGEYDGKDEEVDYIFKELYKLWKSKK